MNTHIFDTDTSSEVYDQTQYRDDIAMGDLLVITSEKIVGFLLSAWPTAVTAEHGQLHAFKPGARLTRESLVQPHDKEDYVLSFNAAIALAKEKGWPCQHDPIPS